MSGFLRASASWVFALLLFGSAFQASPAVFQVTVNTNFVGVTGTNGNINLQFSPGFDSQSATASVSGFSSVGGTLNGAPSIIGGVTGALPGTVDFTNASSPNDYFHSFTFGTSFQFTLTLDGPAVNAPNGTATSGSTFGIALFDDAGTNALLTVDPFGFAAILDIGLDGSITPTLFNADPNTPSIVSLSTSTAIPEPATIGTLAAALFALGVYSRHKR
ncbi:MAG: NF038129 family PEP-CTERM protein [Bryobacterales bacterium]|nr:NF038129 family PEP-CTERM protein [Bryobacterales bacterium]